MKFARDVLDFFKRRLEREKKETEEEMVKLTSEDPFSDPGRVSDNAASDTDAKEQSSHQRVEALKTELARNLDRIKAALARIGLGKYGLCQKCGQPIEEARLKILPTADLCISCARKEK